MPTTSSPSFSQLRAFVALCDHQHFGEAAAALGVSQPSLSQAITALEKRVGGELVERTTRRVLVTSLGEALLPYARDAVLAAEAFNEAASSQGAALSGTMRLGVIPTIAPYLAPVLIDGLREALPQMDLDLREMVTGDNLDQLAQGRLDAAIIALEDDLQRTTAIPMFDEPLVVLTAAGHPWAGRTDVSPTELDDQPLLLLDEGNCLRDQTLALCQRYGSQPPVAVATTLSTVDPHGRPRLGRDDHPRGGAPAADPLLGVRRRPFRRRVADAPHGPGAPGLLLPRRRLRPAGRAHLASGARGQSARGPRHGPGCGLKPPPGPSSPAALALGSASCSTAPRKP